MYDEALAKARSGDRDATANYFIGTMRPAFDELNKAIQDDIALNNTGGVAAANRSAATFVTAQYWIYGAIAATVLFCIFATLALSACVATPLVGVTGALSELAAGHLDAKVPFADRQDEIGQLAGVMSTFKDKLAAAERAKAEQTEIIVSSVGTGLERLAEGDLTHRISAVLTGPFAKLKEDFNSAITHLENTMTKVLGTAGQIANGAGEISQAADDLSRRTEQQAASLEETAAALEEITATLKRTASNTHDVDSAITTATGAAKEGGSVVQSATHAMDAIAQSSKQITDIIGVIDEIAFQTNLLALNAGVEAARAGDAGRGFAVVASEVRALAGRSSEAAKQIKTLISNSGEQVAGGVKLVGESGAALRRIVDQVQQINTLVSEMAGAAEQQSTGIQQVNAAVAQMDQVTQQNAAMVEESTAASRNLADETRTLMDLVSFFHVSNSATASSAATRPRVAASRNAPLRVVKAAVRPVVAANTAQNDWTDF
jgi:methyl-accepting chemotaxis protein